MCKYPQYQCHASRLTQYDYCIRHILTDKSAPYKPCGFTADPSSGSKCGRPAPAYARVDSFCVEHTKSLTAARHNLSRKRKPPASILMDSLAQYKRHKGNPDEVPDLDLFPTAEDPDETETGLGFMALESEGLETGGDDLYITETYVGEGETDYESADSEPEDALQNAGVYTGEEVIRTMKDKLIKLQKYYIDQFQRLGHKMKESRRVYLSQLRAEKEAGLVSIYNQPKDVQEYARMKAMLHYYNPVGRDALLAARNRERRMAVGSSLPKPPLNPPCQHMLTTTTKCNGHCVPLAKFCLKHIMEETGQVLYRPCGVVTPADGPCETPVANLFQNSTCIYHTKLQPSNLSPSTLGEDKKEGGDRKDGIKKEKGVTENGVKEIKRRNLANEISEDKFIKEEPKLSPIKEEACEAVSQDADPDVSCGSGSVSSFPLNAVKSESMQEEKSEFDKLLENTNKKGLKK